MNNLIKKLIREQLLLEKKFAEIKANLTISFELHKTHHSIKRQSRHVNNGGEFIHDNRIKQLFELSKEDIVHNIINGKIISDVIFIIKDSVTNLNVVVAPKKIVHDSWKLYVITVMTKEDFRVGLGQLVITI